MTAGKLSKGEKLVAVDHSTISYPPFRKNFYIEVTELSRMGEAELAEMRKELDGERGVRLVVQHVLLSSLRIHGDMWRHVWRDGAGLVVEHVCCGCRSFLYQYTAAHVARLSWWSCGKSWAVSLALRTFVVRIVVLGGCWWTVPVPRLMGNRACAVHERGTCCRWLNPHLPRLRCWSALLTPPYPAPAPPQASRCAAKTSQHPSANGHRLGWRHASSRCCGNEASTGRCQSR